MLQRGRKKNPIHKEVLTETNGAGTRYRTKNANEKKVSLGNISLEFPLLTRRTPRGGRAPSLTYLSGFRRNSCKEKSSYEYHFQR